eukprot:PhM_4_TR1314/c1_g1_i1/m.52900
MELHAVALNVVSQLLLIIHMELGVGDGLVAEGLLGVLPAQVVLTGEVNRNTAPLHNVVASETARGSLELGSGEDAMHLRVADVVYCPLVAVTLTLVWHVAIRRVADGESQPAVAEHLTTEHNVERAVSVQVVGYSLRSVVVVVGNVVVELRRAFIEVIPDHGPRVGRVDAHLEVGQVGSGDLERVEVGGLRSLERRAETSVVTRDRLPEWLVELLVAHVVRASVEVDTVQRDRSVVLDRDNTVDRRLVHVLHAHRIGVLAEFIKCGDLAILRRVLEGHEASQHVARGCEVCREVVRTVVVVRQESRVRRDTHRRARHERALAARVGADGKAVAIRQATTIEINCEVALRTKRVAGDVGRNRTITGELNSVLVLLQSGS